MYAPERSEDGALDYSVFSSSSAPLRPVGRFWTSSEPVTENIGMSSTFEKPSLGALRVLRQLQTGDRLAKNWNPHGSTGYYSLAVASFSNAVAMCRSDHSDDFLISSTLFAVRHGLEVLLKAFVLDLEIDALLMRVADGKTLEEVEAGLASDRKQKKLGKSVREALYKTLCGYKNLQEGMRRPEFRIEGIDRDGSVAALELLRSNAKEPRHSFEIAWCIPLVMHETPPLWARARERVARVASAARARARESGYRTSVLSEAELSDIVSFFDYFDPASFAFRYPSDRHGEVHQMEWISLEALGNLAERLGVTARCYSWVLDDERYPNCSIGAPSPLTMYEL